MRSVESRREEYMEKKIEEKSGEKKKVKGVGKQKAKIINMVRILKI